MSFQRIAYHDFLKPFFKSKSLVCPEASFIGLYDAVIKHPGPERKKIQVKKRSCCRRTLVTGYDCSGLL